MIPTKTEVLDLLEKMRAENPDRNSGWIDHSIAVGDTAGKLAAALNQNGQHFDVERIIRLGYLHDIGKGVGEFALHPVNGYRYLQKLGYDESYCTICLVHSFVNNDPFCMFSEFMQPERDAFLIEYISKHKFTDEDSLLSLCDCMVLFEPWTIEKRMIDVISRHGVCAQTSERIKETYRIKNYFDQKLGYNLYDLFPEIKENL